MITSFGSNDYLGLSTHPEVRSDAAAAAAKYGCGPRSSALLGGYTHYHRELETSLAALKHAEEALLFPTGYAANMAVLGTLADGPDCAIFSDELNHASIIDGARLAARGAGSALYVYRHNDSNHLATLLAASKAPRKLIVSDSLFSMDGDFADVEGLVSLRDKYGAMLLLDEAHATLVCGDSGGGFAESAGLAEKVDFSVGTLSKAFGSHGGFVTCSRLLKQLILSRGRPGIYSTALPLPTVAAASAALRVASPSLRERLWANIATFASETGIPFQSPICPVIIGESGRAMDASAALMREGFYCPAIRTPTVAPGTARLRIAISARHEPSTIIALAATLKRWV